MSELRQARRDQHLSLDQLARAAGLSKTYLSNLENGHSRRPSLRSARRISAALGKPMVDLWPDVVRDDEPDQELGALGFLSVAERVRVARVLLTGTGYTVSLTKTGETE